VISSLESFEYDEAVAAWEKNPTPANKKALNDGAVSLTVCDTKAASDCMDSF
jgi:hypothetical protein